MSEIKRFFLTKPDNYSRTQILLSHIEDIDPKNIRILPVFRKKHFIKNFFKRNYIINNFFTSDYISAVYDRKQINKNSLSAYKYYLQDFINYRFSKYIISDTTSHLELWDDLFGKTSAEKIILPVLANKDIYYPNENIKTRKHSILFYGSFIPLQGAEKIIKAIRILKDKYNNNDYEITFLGSGQTDKECKKLINKLGLEKTINFQNYRVGEHELSKIINMHSIILGIFGDSKKAFSVVPNKVYQGLACKKCVLTMRSDAIKEFFNDNDLILCKNTSEDISSKLIKLIKDSDLVEKTSSMGYISFNRLFNKSREDFRNFYREIVKSNV